MRDHTRICHMRYIPMYIYCKTKLSMCYSPSLEQSNSDIISSKLTYSAQLVIPKKLDIIS